MVNFLGHAGTPLIFSPEVVKIFEKMERYLTDDDAQNAALPKPMRKKLEAGPDIDELPGAKGEFGRCVTNPVSCQWRGRANSPTCSRLVTPSGAGLFGHRLGHVDGVDVYETVSTDGETWDVIFLSLYHPRKSRKAPTGYRLSKAGERPAFITCTNFRVDGFPFPMEAAIRKCMRRILGFPVRPPNVAELLTSARFVRMPDQNVRLAGIDRSRHGTVGQL